MRAMEHHGEAERYLQRADYTESATVEAVYVAYAQVHATLAQAELTREHNAMMRKILIRLVEAGRPSLEKEAAHG